MRDLEARQTENARFGSQVEVKGRKKVRQNTGKVWVQLGQNIHVYLAVQMVSTAITCSATQHLKDYKDAVMTVVQKLSISPPPYVHSRKGPGPRPHTCTLYIYICYIKATVAVRGTAYRYVFFSMYVLSMYSLFASVLCTRFSMYIQCFSQKIFKGG